MLVKEVHPINILPQIKVRFDGNITLVKLEQPLNTYPVSPFVPILVTDSGIIILVKPEQPGNALLRMVNNPLGRVTLVKPEQFRNAELSTLVTLYVTPETTKDAKIVTAPEAEPEVETVATPEPTVYV